MNIVFPILFMISFAHAATKVPTSMLGKQGLTVYDGTTSRWTRGLATFAGASISTVCSSGTCTKYRATGDLSSTMSLARSALGTYALTMSGLKASGLINCSASVGNSSGTAQRRGYNFTAVDLIADGSGNASIPLVTYTDAANSDNVVTIFCEAEAP